ncbi:hypothetical protein WBG78_22870 [Chryseolinea sp. T2]|uniref:hypothetical protein n=1 Tax=Chryseolinea sp. T2 TaxID=3129255 RepID=UPI0030770270
MGTTFSICLAAALALSVTVCAQDSLRSSTLSFSGGLDATLRKDQLKLPYEYSGTNLAFNSTYTRFQQKGQHVIDFTYSSGKIHAPAYPDGNNKNIFINYDYLFNLKTKSKKFKPSLGMGLHTIVTNVDYYPGIPSNQRKYSSTGSYLTLTGNLAYQLGKRSTLSLQVSLPVVGVITRKHDEISGGNFTSFTFAGQSVLMSAKLEYCYQLTKKLGLIASYRYSYFKYTDPWMLNVNNNGLFFGLRIAL